MIPSPIHKALLIFRNSNARFLLMGGQACILYGAAEFSRDLDLSIGIDDQTLEQVRKILDQLQAENVFIPSLNADVLKRGHACHFRCHTPETEGLRIDLMSRMRGCDDFDVLWDRRTLIQLPEIGDISVLSLPDLIKAKKTQRVKDWPMIRRLIEADMLQSRNQPTEKQIHFWFMECRTPLELIRLSEERPDLCRSLSTQRPLLVYTLSKDEKNLEESLFKEELAEREIDRNYWLPLRAELEKWRHEKAIHQER